MPFAFIPFMLLIVPVVEIGAFIAIGGKIGIAPTLLMILVTAVIGSLLLRIQGLSLLNKIQTEIANGKMPGRELGDGAMIVVAGILLLTPGFVTDTIGFLLFVPFVRGVIWRFVASRITVSVPGGGTFTNKHYEDPREDMTGDGPVIDLDEDEYETGESNPNSPWNKDNDRPT